MLAGFGLLGFPIGTLINAYILYLFLSKKGRTIYSPEYQEVIAATPHVKYRTSIVVWILLALVVVLIAAALPGAHVRRQMIERGHHDLGGRPAGKVERDEHDYELTGSGASTRWRCCSARRSCSRSTSAARTSRRCRRSCTTA